LAPPQEVRLLVAFRQAVPLLVARLVARLAQVY
jgi:hypothetical protein